MNNERRTVMKLSLGALVAAAACAAPQSSMAGALRDQAGPYEIEVLVDGQPLNTYSHRGETYVMGQKGERYVLRVHNRSYRRVEAVVTVDGLDVIDGKPGSVQKRGYLVPAWGAVDIDGWRLSAAQVAAFRFSSVAASYAGRMGQPRNVGVIGVAMFPERVVRPLPRPVMPYRRPAPRPYDDAYGGLQKSEAEAPRAAAPASPANEALADADGRASGGAPAKSAERSRNRPGLGTQFGEQVDSDVHEVAFERANASNPSVVFGVRYNDRRGLVAMGIDVDGDRAWSDANLRRTAEPFPASSGFARPPRGWNGE
ncbi:MAG: hypothetical protein SF187_06170 [Deltaproteobacteria bacterium]|nr:hypothetical protein [Deltaproteobacteria bacterium]